MDIRCVQRMDRGCVQCVWTQCVCTEGGTDDVTEGADREKVFR